MGRFTVVAIVLLAVAAACNGDDNVPSDTPSPSVSQPASGSPAPSTSPTPAGVLLTRGPDIDLPNDMALIIESGCWGCDAPPEDLIRVYRDALGNPRQEGLLAPLLASLSQNPKPFINGLAAAEDGSVIGVSVCIKGTCAKSGLSGFDPESEAVVFRSLDGGITWQEVGRSGPVLYVVAVMPDGQVVAVYQYAENAPNTYVVLPTWSTTSYPEGTICGFTSPAENPMFLTSDGTVYWAGGFEFFQPPDDGAATPCHPILGTFSGFFGNVGKGEALMLWRLPPGYPGETERSVVADLSVNAMEANLERRWQINDLLWKIGWWSYKDDRAIASIQVQGDTPFPAEIDFATRTYSLISAPFSSGGPGHSSLGRSFVHAVQIGPFARVTGTGSCLNLRTQPSMTGEVVTCMTDGVLLHDTGETRESDGELWVSVLTPGGLQGWASATYLER